MSKIPSVNFGLLGEEYYITDFVQVNNPKMQRVARALHGETVDEKIDAVVGYVARNWDYPLDWEGLPTGARLARVFRFWNGFFLGNKSFEYGWLLPNQCYELKRGICFDTACLCTTLLRIKEVEASVVLGMILKTKTQKVLGAHAWTEAVDGNKERIVIETTVHPDPPELMPAKDFYTGQLPVTYDPLAWFNEREYDEDRVKAERYEEIGFG